MVPNHIKLKKQYSLLSLVFIFGCILSFNSCQIEKRLYSKGYYISSKKGISKPEERASINLISAEKDNIEILSASIGADMPIVIAEKNSPSPRDFSFEGDCSTLIYLDGSEKKVVLLEILPSQVKYKLCGNQNGPIFTENRSDLAFYLSNDGTKIPLSVRNEEKKNNDIQIINSQQQQQQQQQDDYKLVLPRVVSEPQPILPPINGVNGFAIAGLICSLIGGFFFLVFGFPFFFSLIGTVLSTIGLIQTSKNKSSGKGLAIAGLVLGAATMILAWIWIWYLGVFLL